MPEGRARFVRASSPVALISGSAARNGRCAFQAGVPQAASRPPPSRSSRQNCACERASRCARRLSTRARCDLPSTAPGRPKNPITAALLARALLTSPGVASNATRGRGAARHPPGPRATPDALRWKQATQRRSAGAACARVRARCGARWGTGLRLQAMLCTSLGLFLHACDMDMAGPVYLGRTPGGPDPAGGACDGTGGLAPRTRASVAQLPSCRAAPRRPR
eukprot:361144-Chlamydomonas_euryale.AAC.5